MREPINLNELKVKNVKSVEHKYVIIPDKLNKIDIYDINIYK